jgi:hypothetical protein
LVSAAKATLANAVQISATQAKNADGSARRLGK